MKRTILKTKEGHILDLNSVASIKVTESTSFSDLCGGKRRPIGIKIIFKSGRCEILSFDTNMRRCEVLEVITKLLEDRIIKSI